MKWYSMTVVPAIAILVPAFTLIPAQRAGAGPLPAPLSGSAEPASSSVHRFERELRLVVADDGNEARYRVREQLAGVEFPSDAVGVTNAISGSVVLSDDGSIVREETKFVVDLTGLKSDSNMRDGFIQRRTLGTEEYPTVEFVPTTVSGLSSPPPPSGEFTMKVTGDMTVRGVTKPITWDITASAAAGTYTGTATTAFTFDDFGLTKPRVARVLSVVDTIRLEYDFKLITQH